MDITRSNRDINSLEPIAKQAAQMFFDECKKQGVTVFATEFRRPQERQDYLYAQGRTQPGKIVTWVRKSNHTSGMAWDIAVSPPNDLYDEKILAKAGKIAKTLGITWGGEWNPADTPHFEINATWKAPVAGVVPKPVVKEDLDYKTAIQKIDALVGIDQKVWYPQPVIKYFQPLIEKISKAKYGVTGYEKILNKLIDENMITSEGIWRNNQFDEEDIKALIKKIMK